MDPATTMDTEIQDMEIQDTEIQNMIIQDIYDGSRKLPRKTLSVNSRLVEYVIGKEVLTAGLYQEIEPLMPIS